MPSILKDLQGPEKGFTGYLGLLVQFEASRGRNAHILRRRRMQAGTDAELSALLPPPASPFTVDDTVTMANDDGRTASDTVTFETTYERLVSVPEFTPAPRPPPTSRGTEPAQ